jgi:hypothetical protein
MKKSEYRSKRDRGYIVVDSIRIAPFLIDDGLIMTVP